MSALGPVGQVNSIYGPQQAALAHQQAQRVAGLRGLVGSILAAISQPQPDAYGAAARDATTAANVSAQHLQSVNPDAVTQSYLAAINAPDAQRQQVGAQNNIVFNGGAAGLQNVGANQAGLFSADQAAHQGYMQSLPGIVGLGATQGYANLANLASKENLSFAQAKPLALQQANNTAFNQQTKLTQLGQGQQRIDLQTSMDAFNQKYKTNQQGISLANLNLASKRFAQQTLQSDRTYKISLAGLGIRQAKAQRDALAAQYKYANGGFTQLQLNKFNATLQHGIDTLTVKQDPATGQKTYVASDANPRNKSGWTKVGDHWERPIANPYESYVSTSVANGVPLQLAIDRANNFFPAYDRPDPKTFANLVGVTPQAAALSTGQNLGVGQSGSGGFVPRGTTFTMKRTDQGRDIQTVPNSPIVAPGAGYVVRIGVNPGDPAHPGAKFGPSYPIVYFTSGPYKGKYVYIGHTTAKLNQGDKFKPGDVLSITGNGGAESGYAPPGWAEIGYAPGGSPGKFGQKPPF